MICRDKASIKNVKSVAQNRLRRLSGIEPRWRRPPCLESGSVCRAAIPRARSTGSQQPLRRQTAGARCGSLGSFQGPAFWNRRHTGPSTACRGDCLRARWVRWRGRDIEKWDCIIDIPPISVTNPDSLSNYRAPQPYSRLDPSCSESSDTSSPRHRHHSDKQPWLPHPTRRRSSSTRTPSVRVLRPPF